MHIYRAANMKRSVFLMAHLFSLLNPRLLIWLWINVMNNSLHNKFVIFSDSLSVLKSLNHTSSKIPEIQNLVENHHELSKTKDIMFCWLPSHAGIKGNEAADIKPKASLGLEISNFKLPCTDFKPFINRHNRSKSPITYP